MRKYALLAMFMYVLSASADAGNFAGPYVILGAGYTNAILSAEQVSQINSSFFTIELSNKLKSYKNNYAGSIGLGIMQMLNENYALGLDAGVSFEHITANMDNTIHETSSSVNGPTNVDLRLKRSYSLLIKPGFIVSPETMLYLLVGPRWGKFQTTYAASFYQDIAGFAILDAAIPYTKNSTTKCGIAIGAGIEQYLWQNFNFSLDYVYTHYGKMPNANFVAPLFLNGAPNGTLENHVKNFTANTNKVTLNIIYRFFK